MEETNLGRIEVSPTAIASIASQAVLNSYGVVGMATKDLASGIVEILQPSRVHRGVDVHVEGDEVMVDLYVVIEYGTRIATVAQMIQSAVRYELERALGVPAAIVNIHVQDLRMSAD